MRDSKEFQERIGRIDGLIYKLESAADPALRSSARELIAALMEMQGAALERILEIVSDSGEAAAIVESISGDALLGSLLVLHDLHPLSFEERVQEGLEKVRPALRLQGVRVETVAIGESVVRLKLVGEGAGEFEAAIREALLDAAPDATEVIIEGGKPPIQAGFVPLSSLCAVDAVRS
jgi:hypothetical protein